MVGMGGSLLVLRHKLVQGGGQGGLLPAVLVLGGLADLPQLGQLLLGGLHIALRPLALAAADHPDLAVVVGL